ncbi:hypothetical protein Tco_0741425 [Tanacetum coccineum]
MFSIKNTFVVHEKTKTPRSYLRWKPTGRIFKTISLRWVPTGKIFTSSTTKVDSESPHGSNTDITNIHECIQNLDSSADTSINVQEEQTFDLNAGSYALSWKPCQGDSSKLNLPDHTEPEVQTTAYHDYQDKDCQGRLLASFQDDAKYEHVGQDIRSQDGKDDKDKQGERFKDLGI